MRYVTLLVVLSGCFGRTGYIRQQSERLVPGCSVDAPGAVEWKEVAPWIYKVQACGKGLWCSERNGIRCTTDDETAVMMRCSEPLTFGRVDFAMGDPLKDKWWWGVDEISGCGRTFWCGERGDEQRHLCEPPEDFNTVAAQLAVETQCPVEQMWGQTRQVFVKRLWRGPQRGQTGATIEMQLSWRIDACGKSYSCTLTGGLAPVVTCKAALDGPAPAPMPAQP